MGYASMSFEEALRESEELLCELEENGINEERSLELAEMLSSLPSCRGFFVSFLTGECKLADNTPDYLLSAMSESEHLPDLLAKNLVMSVCMQVTHRKSSDNDRLAGSRQVEMRVIKLLKELNLDTTRMKLVEMKYSIKTGTGVYAEFLRRWQYDQEQLALALSVLQSLL